MTFSTIGRSCGQAFAGIRLHQPHQDEAVDRLFGREPLRIEEPLDVAITLGVLSKLIALPYELLEPRMLVEGHVREILVVHLLGLLVVAGFSGSVTIGWRSRVGRWLPARVDRIADNGEQIAIAFCAVSVGRTRSICDLLGGRTVRNLRAGGRVQLQIVVQIVGAH